jgi:AraC family transcriptional regulator
MTTSLPEPRFATLGRLLIAGLSRRCEPATRHEIPRLWERFGPLIGTVPGQIGPVTYGVCYNGDGQGSFDYLAGVEVAGFDPLPETMSRLTIEPQFYAVFTHDGPIAGLPATVGSIWRQWLPQSGRRSAAAPDFERYDERFDPKAGSGIVEIWLPLQR